jgi:hypothetical protein
MTDRFTELERWEQLRSKAMDRGFVMNVDRHKIRMTPSMLKVIEGNRRAETHFLSLEEAESWLDGYDWMLEHVTSMGFDLKAAEKAAFDDWDQRRILKVLSSD